MRPTRLTTTLTAGALGLALGAAMLALPAPARAADDDVPFDTKIFRTILEGIGLRRDGAGINYQERAPLVIPPSRDLPPPERTDAAVANNPAWPKDPDVIQRKAQAAAERNRNISEEHEREQNPLLPNELAPGAKTPDEARRPDTGTGDWGATTSSGRYQLTPQQLGTKDGLFSHMFDSKGDSDLGKFTGEPPRASLTDPPPGYQVPSPNQPYGLGKEASAPKAPNYLATHGEVQNGR